MHAHVALENILVLFPYDNYNYGVLIVHCTVND